MAAHKQGFWSHFLQYDITHFVEGLRFLYLADLFCGEKPQETE